MAPGAHGEETPASPRARGRRCGGRRSLRSAGPRQARVSVVSPGASGPRGSSYRRHSAATSSSPSRAPSRNHSTCRSPGNAFRSSSSTVPADSRVATSLSAPVCPIQRQGAPPRSIREGRSRAVRSRTRGAARPSPPGSSRPRTPVRVRAPRAPGCPPATFRSCCPAVPRRGCSPAPLSLSPSCGSPQSSKLGAPSSETSWGSSGGAGRSDERDGGTQSSTRSGPGCAASHRWARVGSTSRHRQGGKGANSRAVRPSRSTAARRPPDPGLRHRRATPAPASSAVMRPTTTPNRA